jgi:Fe-S-cluster containining protein
MDGHEYYFERFENTYTDVEGRLVIVLDKDCPNLTEDGCEIYARRPKVCREFDGFWGIECLNG